MAAEAHTATEKLKGRDKGKAIASDQVANGAESDVELRAPKDVSFPVPPSILAFVTVQHVQWVAISEWTSPSTTTYHIHHPLKVENNLKPQ